MIWAHLITHPTEATADGTQSPLIEEMRRQHVYEVEGGEVGFDHHIYHQQIQVLDPTKTNKEWSLGYIHLTGSKVYPGFEEKLMEVGFDHLSTCREELATTVDGRNPANQFILPNRCGMNGSDPDRQWKWRMVPITSMNSLQSARVLHAPVQTQQGHGPRLGAG